MAAKQMTAWKPKGTGEVSRRPRVLTAASKRIDLDSKMEAQRQRLLRQNWQLSSYTYYDSIPELGYAIEFIAHCVGRLRIFVGALSENGTSDLPVAIDDPILDAPPEVIEACTNALRDLGNGRIALSNVMETLSINISVTGEAFLLGQEDPITGIVTWTIRSIEEIVIYNDEVMLREGPMTNVGLLGLVPLDPAYTLVTRMWNPHPRFKLLAQSAMRRLCNTCEDILIMRRIIRATGRSRLAGRGILLVPAELDIPVLNDDNSSLSGDDFMSKLTDAMITPIRNEGDASGVVPLVIEGPAEVLKEFRWLDFASTFDEQAMKVRAELIENMAVGLDIPAEIITGITDANHWTAYQVSTDTYRQHIEPHGLTLADMLTSSFLRPYFSTCNLDPATVDAWVQRIVIGIDPTELVTPTDLSKSAQELYALGAISAKSLRKYNGFTDEDAPTPDEFLAWLISKQRSWPANLSLGVVHGLNPNLSIPPIETAGTIPGIKPGPGGGVDVGTPIPAVPASPDASAMIGRMLWQLFEIERQGYVAPDIEAAIIAAASPNNQYLSLESTLLAAASPSAALPAKSLRLSRQLSQIDRDLQAKLHVAANNALLRQLEKAGQRVRQKVNGDTETRKKIAHSKNEHVMMLLGQEQVERKGLTASNLMSSEWDGLKEQYYTWTAQAQKAALVKAQELSGGDDESTTQVDVTMAAGLASGWAFLQAAMDTIAEHAAYNPNPNVTAEQAVAALNPDTLVPAGVVRAAVSVAGGTNPSAFTMTTLSSGATVPAIPSSPVGGIGSGSTISDYLSSMGASPQGYTWEWGGSDHPFEPHEDLDGEEFDSWDSAKLDNTGDWPPTDSFFPGDHDGCSCQATPNWVSQDDVDAAQAAVDGS